MKKVLALVLAVMMLATIAMAAPDARGISDYAKNRHVANVTPGSTIKIDKNGVKDTGLDPNDPDDAALLASGGGTNTWKTMDIIVKDENGDNIGGANDNSGVAGRDVSAAIFRTISNSNYTIQRVRVEKIGKNLVAGVTINDKEERVEIKLADDLDNQTSKNFEVSFTMKGKAKFTLRDATEVAEFNKYCATSKKINVATEPNGGVGKRVTLPDIDFKFIGTVGYGKMEVGIGDDNDEEIEDLEAMGVKISDDVVKFTKSLDANTSKRIAGAYTADAILTQDYGDALTLEARVYHNDTLYFDVDNTPNKDIIGRLADSDADMDFYLFSTDTRYTTLNSNATLYFNDTEEDDFVYAIKDGKLVKTGTWSEDDDCWTVKTRILGQYVVSDVELTEFEVSESDVTGNPDTGANDVVGIATALAAVALVSAAAVSLKK